MNIRIMSVGPDSALLKRARRQIEVWPFSGRLSRTARITLVIGLMAGARTIYGQVMLNSVNNQTQMPVPGSGHDYQHLLGETVNFANGSVSFKLTFPTPKGRGLDMPISWTYNSASVNTLDQEYASWGTPIWNDPPSHTWPTKDGWNLEDGVPWATVQVWSVKASGGVNPLTGEVESSATWDPCNFQSGMTFTGLDGITHNLYTYASAPQDNNSTEFQVCPGGTTLTTPPHGDGQVVATLVPNTGSQYLANSSPSSGYFSVMDRNGTVYQFNGGFSSQSPGVRVPGGSITDRNGNEIGSLDTLGRNGQIRSQDPASSGTSSVSLLVGSANDASGTPTGGLQFNSTWTTTSVNYSISVQGGSTTYGCSGVPKTVSGTRSVLSSLSLPNGQSYQFFYGSSNPNDSSVQNPYGLINEVIFPDGGWIKYHWATPSSGQFNEYAEFAGTTEVLANGNENPVYHPYGCVWQYQTPVLAERDVSFNGKTVAQVQKLDSTTSWPQSNSIPWNQKSTTVRTTDEVRNLTSKTVYTYVPYLIQNQQYGGSIAAPAIPLESSITYYDWGQTNPLKTVTKQWWDQFDLASELTTVYGSNGAKRTFGTTYTYETDLCAYNPYLFTFYKDPNNPQNDINTSPVDSLVYLAEQDDYDFGNGGLGPLARKTLYSYQCFASPFSGTVPEPAIPPEVSSVTVEDGSGHIVDATQYGYDGTSPSPTTVIEHFNAYGNSSSTGTTVRGNVTSITRCNPLPSTPTGTCSGSHSLYTFDIAGQPTSMKDPDGHLTKFSFGDSWSSSYVAPVDTGTAPGNTDAYLTNVSYADGLQKTFQYDYETGYLTTVSDENNQSTHYYYNNNAQCGGSPSDGMYRLGEVSYPDGGETAYCYNDSALTVTKSVLLQSTPSNSWMTTVDAFDEMGHKISSTLTTDPDGATSVATEYDGEGKVLSATNPYRGSSPSYSIFQYYDALGRTVGTKEQDGHFLLWCFNGVGSPGSPATTSCNSQLGSIASTPRPGTWVDFTDERGNMWQRTSDAFGNLTEVMEPNGSSPAPAMETDYAYDAMNNLLSVSQYGGAKGNASVRTRNFFYDPLSRLTISFNPETGTVGYTYDLNGNLSTRRNARGIVTTYGYDIRGRLLSKTYASDPTGTPAACYQYGTDPTNNNAGRLIYSWTQSAQSCLSTPPSSGFFSLRHIPTYDAMGRVPGEQQQTMSGSTYSPSHLYDLAGMVTQWGDGITKTSNGALLTFNNTVGGAGRVQTVTSSWADSTHPGTLFAQGSQSTTCPNPSSGQYSPAGALMNAAFGSGLTFNRTYDPRLRVNCELDQGTGTTPATPGSATVTITGQEQTK